jgi:hypothetical protein
MVFKTLIVFMVLAVLLEDSASVRKTEEEKKRTRSWPGQSMPPWKLRRKRRSGRKKKTGRREARLRMVPGRGRRTRPPHPLTVPAQWRICARR